MIQKIKDNSVVIMMIIMVLVYFKQCSISREVSKTKKEVEELQIRTDSIRVETATREEIRKEIRESLFDFLIYETDLDNKKITLTEIRQKVDKK
jgi:hypothetical protein